MQTLVALGTFEDKARALLRDNGYEDLLECLAKRPKIGRIIQGTGGLRKMRVARAGRGKSAGARVVYYYHNEHKPLLLVQIFAKADQENLTAEQKTRLKKLVETIIDEFE